MMKLHQRKIVDFSRQDKVATGQAKHERKPDTLQSKVQLLEDELREGYRQEALTLNATMENMTRIYLTRFQELEKELKIARWEVAQAEKQRLEAQKTQSDLLHQNWELQKTLQHLRHSLERNGRKRNHRNPSCAEITHWKLWDMAHRHYSF